MKKHFMFLMAVLFGLIISMGSCKNSKSSSDDDDEESGKKDKKKKNKKDKKTAKADDEWEYDDDEDGGDVDDDDDDDFDDYDGGKSYDDDDYEFDEDNFDIKDLKGTDIDDLSSSQAVKVLQYACDNSDEIFNNADMDMSMRMRGNDVVIHAYLDFSSQGITVQQFQEALQMPSMRQQLISSMVTSAGNEGKMMFKLMAKANKNLRLEFEDTNSGGTASCSIPKSELEQMGR